ncbi:5280_t:CDS:1, partial [Entrophospora sp. SA101]
SNATSTAPFSFDCFYPIKDSGEKLTHEEKRFCRLSKKYFQKEKIHSFTLESFCISVCEKMMKIDYDFMIFVYKSFLKKFGEDEPNITEICNQKIQDCKVKIDTWIVMDIVSYIVFSAYQAKAQLV